jgi:HEXXH motif-containing protein
VIVSQILSEDDFAKLADGAGGPHTIGRLRAGRLNRQTIMVAALLDLVQSSRVSAADRALFEAGCDLLCAAQDAAPDAAAALLAHPHTGIWAARCLGRLQGRESPGDAPLNVDLGRLTAVAAVAAIRAGIAFEATVPVWDGCVLLPTLGLARVGEVGMAEIRHGPAGTYVAGTGRRVRVPEDPTRDIDGWLGMRRLVSVAGGRRIEIELDDLDPGRDGLSYVLDGRLDAEQFARWQSTLDDAWSLLVREHTARADALAAGVVSIVPSVAEPGRADSVTSQHGFGGIVMSLPADGQKMADTLIHEFQHSKLFALLDLVPLYHRAPSTLHYSPWRNDPRPFGGVLQGAYAYIGVTDFWQQQRLVSDEAHRRFADFEFARWRGQVARAVEMMLSSGRLTNAGTKFVQSMGQHAQRWQTHAVPDRETWLADATVTDHRLLWRLHNLVVDRQATASLASAWLEGVPCPLDPTEVTTAVAAGGAPPVNGRLRLALQEMRDPRFDDPAWQSKADVAATDADVALLSGDHPLAVEQYLREIGHQPDDITRWAGLAQALGCLADADAEARRALVAVPEVVFAVHRAVAAAGGQPPAPTSLAAWLARSTSLAGGTEDVVTAPSR